MSHENKHDHENCDCEHHEDGMKTHACPSHHSDNNWVDKLIDNLKEEFESENK